MLADFSSIFMKINEIYTKASGRFDGRSEIKPLGTLYPAVTNLHYVLISNDLSQL
jgi:hypothetical protein